MGKITIGSGERQPTILETTQQDLDKAAVSSSNTWFDAQDIRHSSTWADTAITDSESIHPGPSIIYKDLPVEVIKEVEKIVYIDKPVKQEVYVDKIVEVIKEVPVEKEVIKNVVEYKTQYVDRIVRKEVKYIPTWTYLMMFGEAVAIFCLLLNLK